LRISTDKNKVHRYLRAAPWPHFSALVSLLAAIGLAWLGELLPGWGYESASWLAWLGAVVMLISAALCQADAWARWQDYHRARSLFKRHGWRPLFLTPFCRSRCQRDAVLLAAHESGFGDRTKAWYRAKGYRWYHLAPDKVVADPRVIVDAGFLKATFMPSVRNMRRG
jgi:hypothetical protein